MLYLATKYNLPEMNHEHFLQAFASFLIAIVTPIEQMYYLLIGMWLANYIVGRMAAKYVDGVGHRWSKTKEGLRELCMIAGIMFLISGIGYFQRVPNEKIAYAGSIIGWIIAWVYLTNITHNGRKLNPKSKIIRSIEYLMKFEIAKKMPFIKNIEEQPCILDPDKICDGCGKCLEK